MSKLFSSFCWYCLITVPIMVGLTVFVKFTKLGKAMRAVEQNPVAAQLMGIHVDRVIGATFVIGGALLLLLIKALMPAPIAVEVGTVTRGPLTVTDCK